MKFLNKKIWVMAVGLLILGAAGALAMSGSTFPKTWNYKITINIETPEGVKTGSAIRQVLNYPNFANLVNPDVGGRTTEVKGEAVVIDLGKRGVVFALINHGSYSELFNAFPVKAPASKEGAAFYDSLKVGASAPLPQENWPMFVTFTDISNPKSVELVRGWKFNPETQKQDPVRHFEKIFGKTVGMKSITIEITDEPVTWGRVDEYLSNDFWQRFGKWMQSMNALERGQFVKLFQFKQTG